MLPRAALLASCLAAASSAPASAAPPVASAVGAQLHSYNDLRSLPQALAKAHASASAAASAGGAGGDVRLLLKLDPQYLDAASCTRFDRARRGDARGCLLLNHDTLSASARTSVNSTDDLAPMLLSPAFGPYTGGGAGGVTLYVSLCFKGCGGSGCPCGSSPAVQAWLSLVDELVADLNAAAAVLPGLRLVLDGDGNPGSAACLAQRWRPWPSVFISGDDPDGAFTQSNASLGWDRLVVLNEPQGASFAVAASLGFGKFAGGGNASDADFPRPYVCWEPSDAAGISAVVSEWASAPAAPNAAGLRFAINIDAAQLDVHAAYAVSQLAAVPPALAPVASGWFEPLGAAGASPPLALTLALPKQQGAAALLLAWLEPSGPSFAAFCSSGASTSTPPSACGAGPLPLRAAPLASGGMWSLSALPLANGSLLVVSTTARIATGPDGATQLSGLLEEAVLVEVNADGSVSFAPSAGTPQPPPAGGPAEPLALAASSSPFAAALSPCGAGAASGSGAPDLASACRAYLWTPPRPDRGATCLVAAALFGGPAVSNFSLPAGTCIATTATSSALLGNITELDVDGLAVAISPYALEGSIDPRVAIAASFSAGSLVFGAVACALDAASGGASGLNDPACFSGGALSAPTTLPLLQHVGAEPSIALLLYDEELRVLEAHGKASCANSETRNKDALVGLCDNPPVRFSGGDYVAYSSGAVSAWLAQLLGAAYLARAGAEAASLPMPWPGASCCSASIAHGSVGTGGAPAAALLPLRSGNLVSAVALTRPASSADPLSCGASAPAAAGAPPLALIAWPAVVSLGQ